MKKRFFGLWAACLCALLLTGCARNADSGEAGRDGGAFAFCGGELADFAAGFDVQEVRCFRYGYTVDTPRSCEITDPQQIQAVFDALAQLRVGGEETMRATDSEQSFTFVLRQGEEYTVRFEQRNLLRDGRAYRLTGDEALWELAKQARRAAEP